MNTTEFFDSTRMLYPLKGYGYLKEIFEKGIEGKKVMDIYKEIASLHGVTPTSVERAIRYCIISICKQKEYKEIMNEIFGSTVKDAPTVGEFIKQIAILSQSPIDKMLKEAGISAGLRGYNYIREAVKMFGSPDFERGMYRRIAEKYGTSPEEVERAIRYAKIMALSRDDLWNPQQEPFDNPKHYPTNKKFIVYLAVSLI